jgi:hypothetical protein
LAGRLPSGIHFRTLGAYELGYRHFSVIKFIEICQILGVSASEMLDQVEARMQVDLQIGPLRIDLHAVVQDGNPALEPLRTWARNRLDSGRPEHVVTVEPDLVGEMAAFCGLTGQGLATHLAALTPAADSGRTQL